MKLARLALSIALPVALGCAASPAGNSAGEIARVYAEQGRWRTAQRQIEIAVRQDPRNVALRHQAAWIHREAGDDEAALLHLEVLVQQLEPQNGEAWIQIGDLERDRGNLQDAYVAYRRAASLAPESLRAVSGLALAADGLGFEAEAEAAYARWAELERQQGVDEVPGSPTP